VDATMKIAARRIHADLKIGLKAGNAIGDSDSGYCEYESAKDANEFRSMAMLCNSHYEEEEQGVW
jgi:hypothetical protein